MKENENDNRMYKYFPYHDIRDGQKKMTSNIYIFLRKDNCPGMILHAANGTGKTACTTSQALLALEDGLFDRVIFAIPRDSTKENILKELEVKHDKKVIKVFSKDILCNWMKEEEDERISAIEEEGCAFYLCKLQGHKCKYKDHGCQYESQRQEVKSADILICDYNYIISPFIRRFSGFEEILRDNRTLLLIDECHMLKPRAEMIFSSSISSTTILRAFKELDKYSYKEEKDFIENILMSAAKEVVRHRKILKSRMEKNSEGIGEVILQPSDIQTFLGTNNVEEIEMLGEKLISVGEEISKLKFERKEGIVSYTEAVGNFISRFVRLINYNKNSAVFFLKMREQLKNDNETSRTIYIGWTPLDVRGWLKNAITRADKYILYSGTMKPSRLRNDVGLGFERIWIPEYIESPYLINRTDIILTKERFYYENLKDESFKKRIIKDLDTLFPNMPKPIGIVCTNQVYTGLDLSSKYNILNEPSTQEEIGDWLKYHVPKAEIIRFTPFGRVAQSVDISALKSIIFLGVPYERYDSIMEEKIDKTAKKLKGQSGNRKAKATYLRMIEPACERVVQSIMRGLRNENDSLCVIYYDVNFKLNKPALGSKNLVVCNTVSEVISHIKNN